MSVETKIQLTEATIEKLQQLIQANLDSHDGFKESADNLQDQGLAAAFRQLGDERAQMANELQDFVAINGEQPAHDGSLAAKVHRVWIDIRSKLSAGDTSVILQEAERGEDYIKHAYEDVLQEIPGSAMSDVLHDQYAKVKTSHDRIRDLRDARMND